jgi:hypothetical protein
VHIKLSEDPKEWRKFMLQACGILGLLSAWLCWRKIIPFPAWLVVVALLLVAALAAMVRPAWFRGLYRIAVQASTWLGERMGRVILTVFFFLLVVPLGWILRLKGHDPLALRPSTARSYWQPAGKTGKLDRMY